MLVDTCSPRTDLRTAAAEAQAAERAGYDAYWTTENAHDPFLPLAVAAESTAHIRLGTAIAVAFARSPMQLAYTAHDLQAASGGRFVLGLGSQVKAHVERRFAMPWSHPAARMRELIAALRAVWTAWDQGERLDFRGDFYAHTLMPEFFRPPPNPAAPAIYLAAVGPQMTRVAGEVADGLFLHALTTARYVREVTLPTLQQGLVRAGRDRSEVAVSHLCFLVTGRDESEMDAARRAVRHQLAFYASTPAYRGVLEVHGWAELGEELHGLSVVRDRDTASDMAALIDDEVLREFAVVAEPESVASAVLERFAGLVDRITFDAPYELDHQLCDEIARQIRSGV